MTATEPAPDAARTSRGGGALRWLIEPLGGWRSGFTWRVYGWALVQFLLMRLLEDPVAYWIAFPGSVHLLGISGLLLVVFGPRRLLLLTAALSGIVVWAAVTVRTHLTLWFPAAEWPLIAGYPAIACAAFLLARRAAFERDFEAAALGGARVLGSVALFAAAFHKLNLDFLDPEVSCIHLRDFLTDWWRLPPGLLELITPEVIIGLEVAGALLLWLAPAVGCLVVALLVLQFGLSTATTFSALIVTAGVASLPESAGPALRDAWRRYRTPFLAVVAAIVATGAFAYRGPRPWLQFAVFQAGIALVAAAAAVALIDRLRRRRLRRAERSPAAPAPPSPRPVRVRAFLLAVLALCVVNAARPYLGLGFQYSFAMLSNLRVDSDRWNSLLVPRPRGLETDDYLHVSGVRYFPRAPDVPPILPALHSPDGLKRKLVALHASDPDIWVGLDFTYRGRRYSFTDGERRSELVRLLASIPDRPLLQEELVYGGPQSCVH